MLEIALKIGAAALAGWLVIVAAAFFGQRALTYFPAGPQTTPGDVGLTGFRIETAESSDGLTLRSWYRPPPEGGLVVALFQGNGGNIAHRAFKAADLAAAGHGVLLVGYRGYGGNPGRPHEEGLYADAAAAVGIVEREGVSPERVVLYGESLGGAVALGALSERRFGGIVLEAPFTSLPDIGAHHYFWLPVRLLARERYPTLQRIAGIRSTLLIVHGERDTIVPPEMGRRLLAAAPEPKQGVFLSSAGHNDVWEWGGREAVLGFLETLAGAASR